ncbi:hypothetical protein HT031_002422 [Scenedesmus sp. PABB004]|nr:hypothetical protein HT031_002422 [Scenedesmus sp. PABB004]
MAARPRGAAAAALALLAALLLAATAPARGAAAAAGGGGSNCLSVLSEFYKFNAKEAAPFTGENMVYFLHIPRTAGRTFHSCLLRLGTPGRRRCPKAYDHLRIDFDVPSCFMLSSHDDFSVVERLPANTAVVSQLRDPIDRFLSAYEFAIEVAARQLRRARGYTKPRNRVVTDDVWPWSYLIPYFVNDIKPRMAKAKAEPLVAPGVWSEQRADDGRLYYWNKFQNTSKWSLSAEERKHLVPNLDPYNNRLFMPLAEFIKQPIATELLHNGEFMQVLGLTNYSHWDKAAELRGCLLADKAIADELLDFALRRIERFAHVGATDKLFESVESAAASLGMPLDGPAYGAGEASAANVERTRTLTWAEAMAAGEPQQHAGGGAAASAADDDAYGEGSSAGGAAGDAPDVHQLAGAARRLRADVSAKQLRWNDAIQSSADQAQLRELRGELNAARAELSDAQAQLVSARSEEARQRELMLRPPDKDKTLELSLGAEFHRCATRAQARNKGRKKSSLLNLRLNDYRQVYFSKEDRAAIPPALIEELKAMNALDVRLHRRALELLEKRRADSAAAGKLQKLPPAASSKAKGKANP